MSGLRQETVHEGSQWRSKWAATACLASGAIALVGAVLSLYTGAATLSPKLLWVAPAAVLTLILALLSALRRERRLPWIALGLALAGTGLIIGWVAVVGLLALATVLIIAMLSQIL